MKKLIFFPVLIFSLTCCKLESNNNMNDTPSNNPPATEPTITEEPKGTITQEYWGTWIQMDTGEEFYINDFSIFKTAPNNKKFQKLQDGIIGYSLEKENILAKESSRYFRKGGKHRKFSMTISGFSDSYSSARAASTGQQGVNGRRENKENESDTENVTTDQNGNAEFTNSVADDEQTITVEDGNGNETSVTVIPGYDGENLGSLPIVEKGMYGFKTTYIIDSDDLGFCYGNNYKYYNLELDFNNIGDITCSTSVYNISSVDPKLEFISGPVNGNFSSILPGISGRTDRFNRRHKVNEVYPGAYGNPESRSFPKMCGSFWRLRRVF